MINIRKATGYDNIPAKLLRLTQNELTHPIANLINNTMAMNTFPDQLKCAELSPLFKKEDNLNEFSTRPYFDWHLEALWICCQRSAFGIFLSILIWLVHTVKVTAVNRYL